MSMFVFLNIDFYAGMIYAYEIVNFNRGNDSRVV